VRCATIFAGAYWRSGFHEDGVVSAQSALAHFEEDLPVQSCLYAGWVRQPGATRRAARLPLRLCLLYLDLDRCPRRSTAVVLVGAAHGARALDRADHLGDPADHSPRSPRAGRSRTGRRPAGPIRLLTAPRLLGYGFNPVSFYYCYDAAGLELEAIVAEINNTPWGERHCYVLPAGHNEGTPAKQRFRFGKDFHVSPFLPMDIAVRLALQPADGRCWCTWRTGAKGRCSSTRP